MMGGKGTIVAQLKQAEAEKALNIRELAGGKYLHKKQWVGIRRGLSTCTIIVSM